MTLGRRSMTRLEGNSPSGLAQDKSKTKTESGRRTTAEHDQTGSNKQCTRVGTHVQATVFSSAHMPVGRRHSTT